MPTPHQDNLYLLALLGLAGVGPVTARNLIAYCGSAQAVFSKKESTLLRIPGIGAGTAQALVADARTGASLRRAEAELQFIAKENVRVLTYLDPDYPEAMKGDSYMPLLLFVRGGLALNSLPAVGIVGTRTPSDYGRKQAARFATALAQAGLNVVSGLAYGIDAEAHKAVVAVGGATTAVLGHGLDRIYPAQHSKLATHLAERGALVSEYTSGTEPLAPNFPARNLIIAGMCRALIVIESGEKGGSMITARQAFNLNREVYAVPGSLDSRKSDGCHLLIQQNVAKLVTSPEEVLQDLSLQSQLATKQTASLDSLNLSPEARRVLLALSDQGKLLDALTEDTGMRVADLVSLLLELEFQGLVRQLPGRRFVRA